MHEAKKKELKEFIYGILFFAFVFLIIWNDKNNCCTRYYELYKQNYVGIVTSKWKDHGFKIDIDFEKGGEQLSSLSSRELVENAEVGDTIIKNYRSMLCTLKTKTKTMIVLYERPNRNCECPDTNKIK